MAESKAGFAMKWSITQF